MWDSHYSMKYSYVFLTYGLNMRNILLNIVSPAKHFWGFE